MNCIHGATRSFLSLILQKNLYTLCVLSDQMSQLIYSHMSIKPCDDVKSLNFLNAKDAHKLHTKQNLVVSSFFTADRYLEVTSSIKGLLCFSAPLLGPLSYWFGLFAPFPFHGPHLLLFSWRWPPSPSSWRRPPSCPSQLKFTQLVGQLPRR